MRQASVALDDILKLTVTDFLAELLTEQALEIVKTIAIHQAFDLCREDQIEGRSQQTARHVRLGQAAKPSIDQIKSSSAGRRAALVMHECGGLLSGVTHCGATTLRNAAIKQPSDRICPNDIAIESVRRDKIRERFWMNHVVLKVIPAHIFCQAYLFTEFVQGWYAEIAAARNIDRRQIEWQAKQTLVKGGRDEFVNLVHLLMRHAQRNAAWPDLCKQFGI